MSKAHGFTVHFIAVIRNGDGNVHYQRQGKKHPLRAGKVREDMQLAAQSAAEEIAEFLCDKPKAPSRD